MTAYINSRYTAAPPQLGKRMHRDTQYAVEWHWYIVQMLLLYVCCLLLLQQFALTRLVTAEQTNGTQVSDVAQLADALRSGAANISIGSNIPGGDEQVASGAMVASLRNALYIHFPEVLLLSVLPASCVRIRDMVLPDSPHVPRPLHAFHHNRSCLP